MKTFTQRFNEIKQTLIEGIRKAASDTGDDIAIIPGSPVMSYSSDNNGWCVDNLLAVASDGVAFFGYEEGIPDGYDIEDDEDDLVSAYMCLDDIMLDGLANTAEALSLMPDTVAQARALIDEVNTSTEQLPSSRIKAGVEINIIDNDGFWRLVDISAAESGGVVHNGMVFPWENIPTDDRCTVLDNIAD